MRSAFYYLINFINTTNVHDVYFNAAIEILKNIYKIPESNIVEVAQMCYVSTATISRLCRKLNYSSFVEFRESVAASIALYSRDEKKIYFDNQLPSADKIEEGKEVFRNHFESVIDNLEATFDNISYDKIIDVVDSLHDAKNIYFLGNHYTQTAAMQLQIELSYSNKPCIAAYAVPQQKEIADHVEEGDVVIISSIIGSFFHMNPDLMRRVCNSKAKVIVITQSVKFDYCDQVDVIINVGNDHNSLLGKFSLTYIFELLEAIYHVKYGKESAI